MHIVPRGGQNGFIFEPAVNEQSLHFKENNKNGKEKKIPILKSHD